MWPGSSSSLPLSTICTRSAMSARCLLAVHPGRGEDNAVDHRRHDGSSLERCQRARPPRSEKVAVHDRGERVFLRLRVCHRELGELDPALVCFGARGEGGDPNRLD